MSRLYLYGFVPADAALPAHGLLGIGDGEVRLLEVDGVAAVVSPVPQDEFDDDRLTERSSDLEWLAALGLQHEQVVAWFVDHSWILPSRLLTLFSGQEAVRVAAAGDAGRIRAELERLEGVREWDLKVGYRPARLEEHLAAVSDAIASLDREIESATPGKRFLLQKKRKDMARIEGQASARRLARELLAELEPLARETRRTTPPTEDAPVLLNVAFLMPRDSEDELVERAARLGDRLTGLGLVVQLSGPWAPYRFLDPPDD